MLNAPLCDGCETEDIFVERQKDVVRNSCLNVTDFELELEELTGQQMGGLDRPAEVW